LVHLEIGNRLLMVPLCVGRWDRKILATMHEGWLGPAFADDAHHLFEGLAITLLVLDRRTIGAAERLVLARLIAPTHAAFNASAADHVELGDLFGKPNGMVPDHDIGALTEADSFGLCRHRHLSKQRVRAHLRAFRLKVMFGQPEGLISKSLSEDALS